MKTISARHSYIIFLPSLSILAAIAVVSVIYQVRIPHLTRDVASIARIHPLSGILSNVGILLWCATASICLFSALTLRNAKSNKEYRFLLYSALLSLYLLFDDLFMFHEELASRYFGLNEKVIFSLLGIAVLTYLIAFQRVIRETDYFLLLVALGFLGSSVLIDSVLGRVTRGLGDWEFFLEDGAKWLGIVSWCSYYLFSSYQLLASSRSLPGNDMQPPVPQAADA